jgi:restriction system protein
MTVPTYDQFIEPILRYLAQHPEGVLAKDAHEAAAVALHLSDEDRAQLLGKVCKTQIQACYWLDIVKKKSLAFDSGLSGPSSTWH